MNSGRVTGKIALVTGSGSGIGRATAILMAQEGATVVAADIDQSASLSVAKEILSGGGRAEVAQLDVTDESVWQVTIAKILANHNHLDILVNVAGISLSKPIAETSFAEWRQVVAVNLDGVFLGIRQAISAMKEGGSIINVASVSGITPFGGAAAYCSSKAAIRMLSKAAAIECADAENGIRINLVTPGGVKTPMWDKQPFFQDLVSQHGGTEEAFAAMAGDVPSQQFFSAAEVAETIVYLASDASSQLTGTEVVLDRGHASL